MKFHPTQSVVAKDNTQYRIVCCGRQWGKTTLAVWEMFGCAYARGGKRVGYFATTHGQARDIAWDMLKQISKPVWYKKPNETLLRLYIRARDGGVSEIHLNSWMAVETHRGTQNDLLVLDEVSKMRNFKEGWQGVLLATLAFRQGKALMISTPYGFNHFHDLYQQGQTGDPLYKSWRFSSYDNPFLDRGYLEGIRSTSTEDFWSQEYLADFRRFTGLIYKEFDISKHVHDFEFNFAQRGEYLFGMDFAVRGYTAAVPLFMPNDIYVLDNYKQEGVTAQMGAEGIKDMLKNYNNLNKYTGYADPAGFMKNQQRGSMLWALADEYLEAGLPIVRANNDVISGINYVRQLFQQDKIHIHPRCTLLIDELLQYQWKEQANTQRGIADDPEKVRKINDHLVDAFRYVLYSKPTAPEEEEPPRTHTFPAKFPEPRFEEPPEEEDKFTEMQMPDSPFD